MTQLLTQNSNVDLFLPLLLGQLVENLAEALVDGVFVAGDHQNSESKRSVKQVWTNNRGGMVGVPVGVESGHSSFGGNPSKEVMGLAFVRHWFG